MEKDSVYRIKQSFYAGIAAITELTLFGNLMDVLKIEKQRNCKQNYYEILKKVMDKGLIRGNLTALYPWGVAMAATRGTGYVYGMGIGKDLLVKNYSCHKLSSDNQKIIASGIGGAFEGSLTTPLSMMRTRAIERSIINNFLKSSGTGYSIDRLGKISNANNNIESPKLRTIVRSLPISSSKRCCDWMLRTKALSFWKKYTNDNLASFLAGISSAMITTPIDRLLPLIQQKNPPKNVINALVSDIKQKGVNAIMAGSIMRILHSGYHTMFILGAVRLNNINY